MPELELSRTSQNMDRRLRDEICMGTRPIEEEGSCDSKGKEGCREVKG